MRILRTEMDIIIPEVKLILINSLFGILPYLFQLVLIIITAITVYYHSRWLSASLIVHFFQFLASFGFNLCILSTWLISRCPCISLLFMSLFESLIVWIVLAWRLRVLNGSHKRLRVSNLVRWYIDELNKFVMLLLTGLVFLFAVSICSFLPVKSNHQQNIYNIIPSKLLKRWTHKHIVYINKTNSLLLGMELFVLMFHH